MIAVPIAVPFVVVPIMANTPLMAVAMIDVVVVVPPAVPIATVVISIIRIAGRFNFEPAMRARGSARQKPQPHHTDSHTTPKRFHDVSPEDECGVLHQNFS